MGKRAVIVAVATLFLVADVLVIVAFWNRRKAESAQCGNHMASIGSAARSWAADHGDRLPSDFLSMWNEVVTPRLLVCPGDNSRRAAASWSAFTPAQSSYEIVTPALSDSDTNAVFLRCKIHGHAGYADATVFDGIRRRTKVP